MKTERLATGISGLDEVLTGGFPVNSINLIMGEPGTGKTVLAEQIVVNNATAERKALYLTTLSEPLEKFIVYGQTHDFFEPAKVGKAIRYEDLGLMVRERGVAALAETVTLLIAERQPKIIVVDSFKALNDLHVTGETRRAAIFDLASVLSSYECTTFLIGEYCEEMMTELPEFAIADGVIQLVKQDSGVQEQRFLRVEKLRGSGYIPGMHAFSITSNGLEVYPRLLTPPEPAPYTIEIKRINTGIVGLDEMIAEGFWCGSTTLVAGPTGSGKTVMGLHFLSAGAQAGQPGAYVGFQENATRLAYTMRNFGWNPEELLTEGRIEVMYHSPVEMQLDRVAVKLFQRVRDGKIKRVVIDSLGDLKRSSPDSRRFSDYMYALTQWFATEGVTSLLLYELSQLFAFTSISEQEISVLCDNIVLLRFTPDTEMERTIRIVKTRSSAHDHREHKLRISRDGIIVEGAS